MARRIILPRYLTLSQKARLPFPPFGNLLIGTIVLPSLVIPPLPLPISRYPFLPFPARQSCVSRSILSCLPFFPYFFPSRLRFRFCPLSFPNFSLLLLPQIPAFGDSSSPFEPPFLPGLRSRGRGHLPSANRRHGNPNGGSRKGKRLSDRSLGRDPCIDAAGAAPAGRPLLLGARILVPAPSPSSDVFWGKRKTFFPFFFLSLCLFAFSSPLPLRASERASNFLCLASLFMFP